MSDKYYQYLKEKGLLDKAKLWLKKNPTPKKWEGTKWAYAYTEMPVWPWQK